MREKPRREPPRGAPEGTIWFGGPVDEACVSLRIYGTDLDPEEITRLLGYEPTESARTGEVIVRPRRSEVVRKGYWKLRTERSEVDVCDQVLELLSRLTDDLSVWKSITSKYDVDLFCGLFLLANNRGISISRELSRILADRGIEIGFDIYVTESGEST